MALDELSVDAQVDAFRRMVFANPVVVEIVERMESLPLPDCWLAAGALFQTVWNVLSGRDPQAGIRDYDLNYFDASDLSWEAEDRAIGLVSRALSGVAGEIEVFAPFGLTDLFRMTTRPNPVLAPRAVYEAKTRRWSRQWPQLTVLPWPEPSFPMRPAPAPEPGRTVTPHGRV